jgi:hypothetical protein
MNRVTVEYSTAEGNLTPTALRDEVLFPSLLGFVVLLLIRYAITLLPDPTLYALALGVTSASCALAAALIYRHVLRQRMASRRHFLDSYLKDDSVVRRYLGGGLLIRVSSSLIAIVLAAVSYVTLQTLSIMDIAAVSVAMAVALLCRQLTAYIIDENIRSHVSQLTQLRVLMGSSTLFVVIALVASAFAQDGHKDWNAVSAGDAADMIAEEIQHPLSFVQKPARFVRWMDISVLRMRDLLAFPLGWLMYLCFLLPSTIPAHAFACLVCGCRLNKET